LGAAAGFDAADGFEGFVIKILHATCNAFTTAQAFVFIDGDHDEANAAVPTNADRADHRLVGIAAELLLQFARGYDFHARRHERVFLCWMRCRLLPARRDLDRMQAVAGTRGARSRVRI